MELQLLKKGTAMIEIPTIRELFDTNHSITRTMLDGCIYPYEALTKIKEFIKEYIYSLDNTYREIAKNVLVSRDADIWSGATIIGPTIIGHGAEIRPGAFIRGNVIVGDGALIGNSTEVKNSIIFDEAKLPHYNYVGDSIIGFKAHMGAGAIASNLRLDKQSVRINGVNTDLRKIGVFLGDLAEIGCNSVLCPGTIIGKEAVVYPMTVVKGIVGEKTVYKAINGG